MAVAFPRNVFLLCSTTSRSVLAFNGSDEGSFWSRDIQIWLAEGRTQLPQFLRSPYWESSIFKLQRWNPGNIGRLSALIMVEILILKIWFDRSSAQAHWHGSGAADQCLLILIINNVLWLSSSSFDFETICIASLIICKIIRRLLLQTSSYPQPVSSA